MNISRNSIFFHISSIASCLLLLFVMSIVFSNLVYAGGTGIGLYKDCYFADDFGGRKTDRLVIRPIGKICFERCEIECNSMLTVANVTDPSLNIDVIQQCKKNCRAGDGATKYNLKFKASDGSIVTKNDISIGSACGTGTIRVDSSSYNVTLSSFVVKKQEQLYVKLFPTANDGYGRLSMCGSASKTLIPVSDSLDNSNWIANYPWSTSPSAWAVKNPYVIDTGIDVKNGDLLSITLETVNGSYFAFQDPQHETSKILVRNPFTQGKSWLPKNGDSMKSAFSVLAEKNLVAIKQNSNGTYEDGTTGYPISNISGTMLANSEVSWNGLFGKADTVSTTDAAGEIVSTKRVFRYAGQLEGFSDKFTRLGLMHFENISNYNSNSWEDNVGGFTVNVSRQGCIYKNGERLQYAVLKETGKLADSTPVYISEFDPSVIWRDLNDVVLRDYEPLTIDEDGMVAFRIKPLSYNDDKAFAPECTSNDSECLDSKARVQTLYGPANSDGKYLIQVELIFIRSTANEYMITTSFSEN